MSVAEETYPDEEISVPIDNPPQLYPEDQLIIEAQTGNTEALSEAFAPHIAVLRWQASCMQMGDETDDMMQTTFEKAQQRLHSFEVGPGLRTWLTTILINSCIDHKRKAGRRPIIDSDSDYGKSLFENPAFVATPADPYEYTETKMLSEQLQAVLSALSPEHFDVLREVAFGSMKYEEFANSRGIPVGTVRSRLSNARSNAQQLLINAGLVTIDLETGRAKMADTE